jgi:hypothetical protein
VERDQVCVVLWNKWNLGCDEKIVNSAGAQRHCEEVSRDPSKIPVGSFVLLLLDSVKR